MLIDKNKIDELVLEYNKIQQKKSKLSRRQRDGIEEAVRFLVENNVIKIEKTEENEQNNLEN